MSFIPLMSFTNTASECLIGHVILGCHSTHREWLVKLRHFFEAINLLLVLFIGVPSGIKCLLMILDTAHEGFFLFFVLIGRSSFSLVSYCLDWLYWKIFLIPSIKLILWSDQYIFLFWALYLFRTHQPYFWNTSEFFFQLTHLLFWINLLGGSTLAYLRVLNRRSWNLNSLLKR